MARRRIRFTVRLTEEEFGAMTTFSDHHHLIPSVAMRTLLARGMGPQSREQNGLVTDTKGLSRARA